MNKQEYLIEYTDEDNKLKQYYIDSNSLGHVEEMAETLTEHIITAALYVIYVKIKDSSALGYYWTPIG